MLLALGLVAALLSGCGGTLSSTSASADAQKIASLKGDATKGKSKYLSTCSACHGVDAKGLTALGKDLTASVFTKNLSDRELISFIIQGRSASDPAFDLPRRSGSSLRLNEQH